MNARQLTEWLENLSDAVSRSSLPTAERRKLHGMLAVASCNIGIDHDRVIERGERVNDALDRAIGIVA